MKIWTFLAFPRLVRKTAFLLIPFFFQVATSCLPASEMSSEPCSSRLNPELLLSHSAGTKFGLCAAHSEVTTARGAFLSFPFRFLSLLSCAGVYSKGVCSLSQLISSEKVFSSETLIARIRYLLESSIVLRPDVFGRMVGPLGRIPWNHAIAPVSLPAQILNLTTFNRFGRSFIYCRGIRSARKSRKSALGSPPFTFPSLSLLRTVVSI
jgi:hypothetical protein